MRSLSCQNMMDAARMERQGKNIAEVQIFLLSRFFGMTKQKLKNMPFADIYPLMQEMGKYIDDQNNQVAAMENGEPDNSIEDRWELLDFGAKDDLCRLER